MSRRVISHLIVYRRVDEDLGISVIEVQKLDHDRLRSRHQEIRIIIFDDAIELIVRIYSQKDVSSNRAISSIERAIGSNEYENDIG